MPRSGEESRLRLQRAAFELFQERGYDQTTAAEIAERAGVTERTFFRHFPDKKEVLFANEAEFRDTLIGAVATAPRAFTPLDALLAGFRAVSAELEAYRPYSETRRKVIAEARALQERELAKAAALIDGLAEALRGRGVESARAMLAAHMGAAAFLHATTSWAGATGAQTEWPAAEGLNAHLDRAFDELRALAATPPNFRPTDH